MYFMSSQIISLTYTFGPPYIEIEGVSEEFRYIETNFNGNFRGLTKNFNIRRISIYGGPTVFYAVILIYFKTKDTFGK